VTVAPFPLIEIAGPPFARGESYGAQARKRILRSIAALEAGAAGSKKKKEVKKKEKKKAPKKEQKKIQKKE